MLTVEKDKSSEHIYIHGSPEKLKWLAQQILNIAEAGELNGKAHEHFMTSEWAGDELTSKIQGSEDEFSIINKLTIYSWAD